jgi:hypothetical protein
MIFPVHIAFKVLALAPQMYVRGGDGTPLGFVREKLLNFVDDVQIFSDETQSREIYRIRADRIIDFSATYHFTTPDGAALGSVERHGFKSLWRATYTVRVGDEPRFQIVQEKPFAAIIDNLIDEIPGIGLLTGMFLNPTYLVTRENGAEVLRIVKRRSLLETDFSIEKLSELDAREQECALLAAMMIVLLERKRS